MLAYAAGVLLAASVVYTMCSVASVGVGVGDGDGDGAQHNDYDYVCAETDHCYRFEAVPANWSSAQAACVAQGGTLAVPNSDAEAALLVRLFSLHLKESLAHLREYKGAVATGIFRSSGVWKTVDGQLAEHSGYSKWIGDQPTNATCCPFAMMYRSGALSTMHSGFKLTYFCEKVHPDLKSTPDDPIQIAV